MRSFVLLAFLVALPGYLNAQSQPIWGRDYVYGPAGQLTLTVEPDIYAPSAPEGLVGAFHFTGCYIQLTWIGSVDFGSGIGSYTIYQNGVSHGGVIGAGTSYRDYGFIAGNSYTYYVKGSDKAGNFSPASNTIEVDTTAGCGLSPTGAILAPKLQFATFNELISNETPLLLRRIRQLSKMGVLNLVAFRKATA